MEDHRCRRCGRKLKDPKRVALDIGRKCEKKEQEELEELELLGELADVLTMGPAEKHGGRQILLKVKGGDTA